MDRQKHYDELIAWYKDFQLVSRISSVLQWDQRTYMPKLGMASRAEQLALIDGLAHRKLTEPAMVAKLNELAAVQAELSEDQRVNLREIKREVDRATKVPNDLVEEISRHTAKSNAAWVEAREADNFNHFAPFLARMIELRKLEAAALGFADRPYDAALDLFEPGSTEPYVRKLLEDLRQRLVPFVHKVLGAEKHDDSLILREPFPIDKQREFGLMVIGKLGFNFDEGRQDISAHPFTIGSKGDVRITTRFNERDLRQSLFAMIHEAGHALYEMGLPDEHVDTPLGQSVSLAVHESQSRFFENTLGRSLAFWTYFYPDLKAAFPTQLGGVPLLKFYEAVNIVAPSLIRVEADEVTYNLHIVLRFEIERAFMAGEVAVADLPDLWRAKVKQYLDIDAPNDADGVLQDVHWSEGLIGYFPTYTMGNLYGAQLREKIMADLGDIGVLCARGEFAPILNWMREHVHRLGKRYTANELIERATGKKPTAEPFMRYLAEKYGPLYHL
jgi:carboxypeptidase Taq